VARAICSSAAATTELRGRVRAAVSSSSWPVDLPAFSVHLVPPERALLRQAHASMDAQEQVRTELRKTGVDDLQQRPRGLGAARDLSPPAGGSEGADEPEAGEVNAAVDFSTPPLQASGGGESWIEPEGAAGDLLSSQLAALCGVLRLRYFARSI
jgi:hypothetical protein